MSRAESTLLAESDNYREVLELRPCDAVPSLVEIRISSWWRDAKSPASPQLRFQTFVAHDALMGLKNAVEAVLARSDRPSVLDRG